jgi:hypothetical protein
MKWRKTPVAKGNTEDLIRPFGLKPRVANYLNEKVGFVLDSLVITKK